MVAHNLTDLLIALAYFSIPVQILASLWKYPRLASMPVSICVLLVLFALFIFLCGTGHCLRAFELGNSGAFRVVNILTAWVSIITALYLLPLIPNVLGKLDGTIVELRQLNEEAVQSKKKLFTFMAFLCHEIRNPLFALTSSATSLQEDTVLSEEQDVAVTSIMDSAVLMLRLVNDVLDLSKIDTGKLQLENKTFNLRRLLKSLSHTVENQIQNMHGDNVQFGVFIAPEVPKKVCADYARLLQCAYNLLSNSCKFTDHGRIDLNVSVCSEEEAEEAGITTLPGSCAHTSRRRTLERTDDSDEDFSMALLDAAEYGTNQEMLHRRKSSVILKIAVSDTGCGIADDRMDNIFEPYSQAKLSDYRKHGGTGLGLSIITGLTKAMGGKISATSKVGVGSSFVLFMPLQVDRETDTPVTAESSGSSLDVTDPLTPLRRSHVKVSHARIPRELMENCLQTAERRCSASSSAEADHLAPGLPLGPSNFNEMHELASPVARREKKPLTDGKQEIQEIGVRKTISPSPSRKLLEPFALESNGHVVMIVDDNAVNQKIIAKMLSHFKLEYTIAENGQIAIDKFRESRNVCPDKKDRPRYRLVFMDLCMPVKDGYEATAELRKMGVTIPIVALTANALLQEKDRAEAAGATDFQTKPILRKDMYAVCRKYLH